MDYGNGDLTFEFAESLSAPQEAALDVLLGGWVCPDPIEDLVYEEDDAESVTTSTTQWIKKLTKNFAAADGDYLIEWSAEAKSNKNNTKAYIRCELDDTTKINSGSITLGEDFSTHSGFKKVNLSEGTHKLDIDYKTSKSRKPMTIRNARIKVTRI